MPRLANCLFVTIILSALLSASAAKDKKSVRYKTGDLRVFNGVFNPVTGEYGATGNGRPVGEHSNSGTVVDLMPVDESGLLLSFCINDHEVVDENGDKIFLSGCGLVELIPLGDDLFSADWELELDVDGGTGAYESAESAKQPLIVRAINAPFKLTDATWIFSWEFKGKIMLDK